MKATVLRVAFLVGLAAISAACSRGPKDELIAANVQKMVGVDRSLGFTVQIDGVKVEDRSVDGERAVVKARVTGWATHPEVHIGAILPAEPEPKKSWAEWEFTLHKSDAGWIVDDKFKVDEGFVDE